MEYFTKLHFQEYLDELDLQESSKKTLLYMLTAIIREENKNKKSIYEFTGDEILAFLDEKTGLSKSNFYTQKGFLKNYLTWIKDKYNYDIEYMKILSKAIYEERQFSNIDRFYFGKYAMLYQSLINAAEAVADINDQDILVYDTAICAALLAWEGLTLTEVCNIKKADINADDGTIWIQSRNKHISVNKKTMHHVTEYATTQRVPRKAKINEAYTNYYDSIYLFRSFKKDKLDKNNIYDALSRLNKGLEEFGKKFKYDRIYLSGKFYNLYLYELNNEEIKYTYNATMSKEYRELLEELFSKELDFVNSGYDITKTIREYIIFKQLFYSS